jgi:nucleoside 2-deoxyribosyltransferase
MVDRNALKVEEGSLGVKHVKYIMEVNMDKLRQLNREYHNDLPTSEPRAQTMEDDIEEQKQADAGLARMNDLKRMSMFSNEEWEKKLSNFLKT